MEGRGCGRGAFPVACKTMDSEGSDKKQDFLRLHLKPFTRHHLASVSLTVDHLCVTFLLRQVDLFNLKDLPHFDIVRRRMETS